MCELHGLAQFVGLEVLGTVSGVEVLEAQVEGVCASLQASFQDVLAACWCEDFWGVGLVHRR